MNFKVVLRNLLKRPFLNMVKIIGLSLALTGIIFISLFLKNELTYDGYHTNSNRIYRYTLTDPDFIFGKHFARQVSIKPVEDFPEAVPGVENFVRMRPARGGLVRYKQMHYSINQGFEVDSTFFKVFEANLLVGDKETALENPASLVVTKSYAQKVFGDKNPIGETIEIPEGQYYGQVQGYTVKGVMEDFPANSHFHPDFIATPIQDKFESGWAWCYLVLSENAQSSEVETSLENYLAERFEQSKEEFNTTVYLQKITDIHLKSHKLREIESNGNMRNVYVLTIAALMLLIISISNYANLNIGMSGFSSKYLYVNKILGSSKKSAILYFLYEGLVVLCATLFLTLLIALPVNSLIVKFYSLNLLLGNTGVIFLIVLGFSALSIFVGILPTFKSIFNSLSLSQSKNTSTNSGGNEIKYGLIVFQYAFSIALIISVLVITRQTNYALNNGLGVEQNNILIFENVHASLQQKFGVFKQELQKFNSIETVSAMLEPPGGEANDQFPFEMEGYESNEDENQGDRIGVFPCDHDFAELFGLELISGENFSDWNKDNEGSGEYIINEAALKRLNYSDASEIVGKQFKLDFVVPESDIVMPKGRIIGVVKDFHLSSMKKEVEPLVLFKRENMWLINFAVAFKSGMQQQALADMERVWNNMFPEYPFQYEHVGSLYKKVYKSELLQARLLSVFTIIALFICAIGLFALALIITRKRVKEIGIRKVNGARVTEILSMLNKDFLKWVLISFVIACPAAWFAMHKWLENFAYKTTLSWWIFAIAGVLALGIAILTVSFQSWKAATRNPVEALRYE